MRPAVLEPNSVHDVYVNKLNALITQGRDADACELASTFAEELRNTPTTATAATPPRRG